MRFRLSKEAQEDIITISETGIAQFGERQARAYHNALFDLFDLISANPRMARERIELVPPVRVHRFKAHLIIYQIEDENILIVRVRHGREDWLSNPT